MKTNVVRLRIAKGTLIVIGSLLIIDSILLILFSNVHAGHLITFVLGWACFGFGLTYEKAVRFLPTRLKWALCIAAVIIILVFLSLLIYGTQDTATYKEDALIVLGAGIHGEEPTQNLKARLDIAIGYYEKNQNAVIIVSGGKGPQEDITEAQAMKKYLIEQGIPSSRILCEERATSTKENFEYSKIILDKYFDGNYCVAFISNDYHIYRAEKVASAYGYDNVTHVHSDTIWYALFPNTIRECIAAAKQTVLG